MDDFFKNLPPPPDQPARVANPRRKIYLWFAGAGGFVMLCGIAVALEVGARHLLHATEAPATALHVYTDTLIKKDYKDAYAITAEEYRSNSNYAEFMQFQTKLADRLGVLKSAQQVGWDIETQDGLMTCTIITDLQFERGKAQVRFILLQEKDRIWRVLSFQEINKDSGEE